MRLRIPISLAIVVVVVVAGGIADAKIAPSEVTIEGDDLAAPIQLDVDDAAPSGDRFHRIVEGSGFYPATLGQSPSAMVESAPTTSLGPSLVLTYAVDEHGRGSGILRQIVYPLAEGGPLTYTEPGQRFFDTMEAAGGWYRAPMAFVNALESAGVPVDDMRRLPGADARPTPVPVPGPGSPAPWLNGVIAGAVALGLVGAIMAVRRTRLAPG